MAAAAYWAVPRRGTDAEKRLRRIWCWFIILWQILATLWWLRPSDFRLSESLPLQLCDIVVWVAPIALLTQRPWPRALLYFWGIGLSTQAFFTPVLVEGPATIRYWLFWIGHTQIVGSAIYDIVVLRYRPTPRDFLRATAANLMYAAIVMPINLAWGVNYGYIGNRLPEQRTLLHALPPWPWRVLVLAVIVQTVMALIWVVWPIRRWVLARVSKAD
jgi:hypothetical integral membrane protein (TIGR02206 family)